MDNRLMRKSIASCEERFILMAAAGDDVLLTRVLEWDGGACYAGRDNEMMCGGLRGL